MENQVSIQEKIDSIKIIYNDIDEFYNSYIASSADTREFLLLDNNYDIVIDYVKDWDKAENRNRATKSPIGSIMMFHTQSQELMLYDCRTNKKYYLSEYLNKTLRYIHDIRILGDFVAIRSNDELFSCVIIDSKVYEIDTVKGYLVDYYCDDLKTVELGDNIEDKIKKNGNLYRFNPDDIKECTIRQSMYLGGFTYVGNIGIKNNRGDIVINPLYQTCCKLAGEYFLCFNRNIEYLYSIISIRTGERIKDIKDCHYVSTKLPIVRISFENEEDKYIYNGKYIGSRADITKYFKVFLNKEQNSVYKIYLDDDNFVLVDNLCTEVYNADIQLLDSFGWSEV